MRRSSTGVLATAGAAAAALLFIGVSIEGAGPQRPQVRPFSTIPAVSNQSFVPGGTSGSVVIGNNVNVTNKSGAQSETSVASDPTNRMHLLESVNDLTNTAAVYESTDGGATWVNSNLTTNGGFCYDTWLGFNLHGDAFVSFECSDQRIAYKLAGTNTWVATKLTNAGNAPDRDMVTIDNSPSSPFFGSVYIGYDDNGANNTPYAMYSRDGISGWTRSAAIPHPAPVIGVNLATAPDGTLYAAWEDYGNKKLYTSKSTDGGATFGPAVLVDTYRINTTGFFIFIPPQNIRGILPYPMTAVAPSTGRHAGRYYISYTDQDTTGSNTSIYVRYSDDGGATWSSEAKVNDDTTHAYHFHHQIAVSPTGLVAVCFYDTRRDSTNKKTDRFVSLSNNGGVTWSPNFRYTNAQSNETVSGVDGNQYGDYQGVWSDLTTGKFLFSWTDSRSPGAIREDMFAGSFATR